MYDYDVQNRPQPHAKVDISDQQEIETKTWVCHQIFVTEASQPNQSKIIFWSLDGSPLMQELVSI